MYMTKKMKSKNNPKAKIMVGTPMYGGLCYHGYASGLASSILTLNEHDVDLHWHFIANESLITRGRNNVVKHFMKTDCTHLMFIDADIHFPGDAILKLYKANEDIVCGAYPKKFIDWENIKKATRSQSPAELEGFGASYVFNFIDTTKPIYTNKKGLIEVKHAGTGFMLIKRQVFEKLDPLMPKARASNFGRFSEWYTEYFKTEIDEEGVLQTEDWFFCNQWAKANGKIYLMPSINLDHIGTYIYRGDLIKYGANIT